MEELGLVYDRHNLSKKKYKLRRKLNLMKKKKYISYNIPCLNNWERLNVDIKMNREKYVRQIILSQFLLKYKSSKHKFKIRTNIQVSI